MKINPENSEFLTVALPKGRLLKAIVPYFEERSLSVSFPERGLHCDDTVANARYYLVKNKDLPVFIEHNIAGLGICGEDTIRESSASLYKLLYLPFGGTKLVLAASKEASEDMREITVATSYPIMTREYFHRRHIPVSIVPLSGSVELAPRIGLAPYIVDLTETGSTLKANGLKIIDVVENIRVCLVANKAYYKLHHKKIDSFMERLG